MTVRVPVATTTRHYEVVVGRALLTSLSALIPSAGESERLVVVSDDNVAPLYLDTVAGGLRAASFDVSSVVIPHGEAQKTLATLETVYGALYGAGLTRRDVVVALGGGVVGDLAGFAAATFQRGVRLVQVPTSLLAMVDASVGGKTAVDYRRGKNYVGSFYQPLVVVADLDSLATLPEREVRSGWAEVVKHGLLAGGETLDLVEGGAATHERPSERLIETQVACKASVVARDEREETGERAQLNLGHTIGHAIEAATGFRRYTHGEAVALGLRATLWLSERLCGLSGADADRAQRIISAVGLPERLDDVDPEAVRSLVRRDKKADRKGVGYVLLSRFGAPAPGVRVEERLEAEVIEWLQRR
jgi:3-dehydroquinate synthase